MLDHRDTEALAAERRAAGTAEHLLATEGRLLDLQDWDAWLDCYTEDCTYWVPVWKDEVATVSDPAREVSLIYHTSRLGLEERVIRIRTRKSVTAMPLPRTVHMVSNVLAETHGEDEITGSAAWNVQHYDPRVSKRTSNAGHYDFTLRRDGKAWRIARKKVTVLDDLLPAVIDFYGL